MKTFVYKKDLLRENAVLKKKLSKISKTVDVLNGELDCANVALDNYVSALNQRLADIKTANKTLEVYKAKYTDASIAMTIFGAAFFLLALINFFL